MCTKKRKKEKENELLVTKSAPENTHKIAENTKE